MSQVIKWIPFVSTPATAPHLKHDRAAIVARSVISGIAFGILAQVGIRYSKHYGLITLAVSFLAYQITSRVESWRSTNALNNLALNQFFGNDKPASKEAMQYLADSENDGVLENLRQRLQNTADGSKHALKLCEFLCQSRSSTRILQIRDKLQLVLKNSDAAAKYQALLMVLSYRFTNSIHIDTGVKVEDFFNPNNRVPQKVLDSIDIHTFHAICPLADPSESSFNGFWSFVMKFDDLSLKALDLFNRLLERRPGDKSSLIQWCMQDAIEHGKPEIVDSLIKNFSEHLDADNPETVRKYWLYVKDARTAQLLKEHFPNYQPTAELLNGIVCRDAASYDQADFTQENHVLSIPGICLTANDVVIGLCIRLNKQPLAGLILAEYLLNGTEFILMPLLSADRATFEALCARSNGIDLNSDKYPEDVLVYFWNIFCKFDYCDDTENSLFRKIMACFDSKRIKSFWIIDAFKHAASECCPGVVRYLLSTKRIKPTDFTIDQRFNIWAYLQNKDTCALLQQYGFDVNEHPKLLDKVISCDQNFTAEHLNALFRAGINKEWVAKAIRDWEGKGKDNLILMMIKYLQPQEVEKN